MKITKIGVMTDPGAFSPLAIEVKNISAILITHQFKKLELGKEYEF
jgi:hypothetical protein